MRIVIIENTWNKGREEEREKGIKKEQRSDLGHHLMNKDMLNEWSLLYEMDHSYIIQNLFQQCNNK